MPLLTSPTLYKKFLDGTGLLPTATSTTIDDFLAVVIPEVDTELRKELNLPVIEQTVGIVEYASGNGTPYLTLKCAPVQSVSEVVEDQTGAWGQNTTGFTATALTAGIDYAIDRDSPPSTWSRAGRLVRLNATWLSQPYSPRNRLSVVQTPSYGNIRVTYTAGLTDDPDKVPLDLQLAANLLISQIRVTRLFGFLTTSEGLAEYHYTLGNLLKGFMNIGQVAEIIGKYKEIPV